MDGERKIDVYTHVGPNANKSALVSIEFEKRGFSGPNVVEIIPSNFTTNTEDHGIEALYMCPLPVDVKIEAEEMVPENSGDEDGNNEDDNDDQDENDGEHENGGQGDQDVKHEYLDIEVETKAAVFSNLDDPNPALSAYFDFFKGLYPDYAKLDPGRKELFRCTLDRLIKEQSVG